MASKSVERAANSGRSTVEHVGMDHRRLHVVMAQKFLYGSNVIATFERVSGEGMLERMGAREVQTLNGGRVMEICRCSNPLSPVIAISPKNV